MAARILGRLGVVALALSSPVVAQMAVTDPGSYAYYAEEIAQGVEQLQQLKNQYEELQSMVDEAEETTNALTGNTMGLVGAIDDIDRVRTNMNRTYGSLQEAASWGGRASGTFQNAAEALDQTFRDPGEDQNRRAVREAQRDVRQMAMRDAILRAESINESLDERINRLDNLANRISGTSDVKASVDLQNRILIEIAHAQAELIGLLSSHAQAEAMENYRGVDPNEVRQRRSAVDSDVMDEVQERAGSSFVTDWAGGRPSVEKLLMELRSGW